MTRLVEHDRTRPDMPCPGARQEPVCFWKATLPGSGGGVVVGLCGACGHVVKAEQENGDLDPA